MKETDVRLAVAVLVNMIWSICGYIDTDTVVLAHNYFVPARCLTFPLCSGGLFRKRMVRRRFVPIRSSLLQQIIFSMSYALLLTTGAFRAGGSRQNLRQKE